MEKSENEKVQFAKKTYHGFHTEAYDLSKDADALAAKGFDVEGLKKIIEERSKAYKENKKED